MHFTFNFIVCISCDHMHWIPFNSDLFFTIYSLSLNKYEIFFCFLTVHLRGVHMLIPAGF